MHPTIALDCMMHDDVKLNTHAVTCITIYLPAAITQPAIVILIPNGRKLLQTEE